MKKLLFAILCACGLSASGQDVIVKTDQTEIKSKVTEITETSIKYKRWDNLEGPVYNIAKTEVFMIIYANGKRETIAQPHPDAPKPVSTISTNSGYQRAEQPAASPQTVDTVLDYKKIRVKYAPSRVSYWFDNPPLTLGVTTQSRIVKNVLNFGADVDFFFIKGAQQTMYSLYLAPYLPLNRMMKNYKAQDKGLFLYAKIGYAAITYKVDDYSTTTGDVSAGFGADFFVTKHFGISLGGDKFGDGKFAFKGGICFK